MYLRKILMLDRGCQILNRCRLHQDFQISIYKKMLFDQTKVEPAVLPKLHLVFFIHNFNTLVDTDSHSVSELSVIACHSIIARRILPHIDTDIYR